MHTMKIQMDVVSVVNQRACLRLPSVKAAMFTIILSIQLAQPGIGTEILAIQAWQNACH